MEHFLIITNKKKDPGFEVTNIVKRFLEDHGRQCEIAQLRDPSKTLYDVPESTDCCIVLGGDGTMLQAGHNVLGRDIPLLGINMGTLGYLAEIEKDHIEDALLQLLKGEHTTEKRMMLRGSMKSGFSDDALNDIVITRQAGLQVIRFDIFVNGLFLNHYEADGMIISTPTGSTGYNMSAGGPIVKPDARMLLLTPICPHTLGTRSIVLSPEDRIGVRIGEGRGDAPLMVEASFDGREGVALETGNQIEITASPMVTQILKLGKESFLEVLHQKL